ncbi:cleavage stimulating factor 64 [Cornus florida]|uniref:cleavage stimulating factor 64 n=1 Tax=Cornus florida TaxID=4283 RepID=UPI00289DF4BF|nr:cleavage stimulating factor 64 [Cornus florida]
MAGKPITGEDVSINLAGMSKNQLYDIMSQMKTLIEQNKQQARQILIQNPLLTRALFQAQIMLGMVQPPQVIPSIQPAVAQHPQQSAQHPQQSAQPAQQSNIHVAHSLPGISASETPNPIRKQQQNEPLIQISSAAAPPINPHSQSLPSHPLQSVQQPKGHHNGQASTMSLPQASQIPNTPPLPIHSASQPPSLLQPPIPTATTQLQQPLQTSGIPHLPQQPPLPPQPRPPSMPVFPHQVHSQMGPNVGFQHSGAPQLHHSQFMFPSVLKPQFLQGQPPLPSQLPPQSLYQVGGSHLGTEFNSQVGNSMQADRGSAWMPGLPENTAETHLPGPPPLVPGLMGAGNQQSRAPPLSPEMEKALLQQVMSLTPEQINLLPPEQRNQVLQLQQMLRQ